MLVHKSKHAANHKCVGISSDVSTAPYVQDYNASSTPDVESTLTTVTVASSSGLVSMPTTENASAMVHLAMHFLMREEIKASRKQRAVVQNESKRRQKSDRGTKCADTSSYAAESV